MNIGNRYLVAPLTNMMSGSTMGSRKVTVHDTHDSAVADASSRSQDYRSNQKFVIYQAVTMVGRTERPIEVCTIEDDGGVTC